jgi:hypothetical protein
MTDHFRCPHCGKRQTKTYRYGAVRGQSGNMVARETLHPDVTCACGASLSGREIVGGLYDPPPLTISPFVRCLVTSIANALFWGGVTYIFASTTTSLIVGLAAFALLWLAYLTGAIKIEPFTWR